MSLKIVLSALNVAGRNTQSMEAWAEDEDLRARKVDQFRRYADGDHDNNLTTEQRRLLNQRSSSDEDSRAFADNLCSIILDTPLDRIQLIAVRADNETGTAWAKDLANRERLDALQVDVSEAALRDGNTYLMVYPDPLTRQAHFSHEPAYDGNFGTVLIYESAAAKTPLLAIKVWKITTTELADTTRVNVYYPDRIERWVGETATGLRRYSSATEQAVEPWVDRQGQALGVPFIHFKNRGSSVSNFGLSELENVIPLQDATNVVLTSIVATALLSGFPIRALIGDEAPAAVTPGQVLSFFAKNTSGAPTLPNKELIDWLNAIRLEQFEVAELAPLLSVADWLKGEMFAVTNTPTDDVAADASGEARKQSEVKLIGKVKRFETRNGNAWEDAFRLAARIEEAFTSEATGIDEETVLTAEWADPEVRNDSKFVEDMLKQYKEGVIDQRTYLESVKDIYDWDTKKIDEIIQRTEAAKNAAPPNIINPDDANGVQDILAKLGMNGANEPAAQPALSANGANTNGG